MDGLAFLLFQGHSWRTLCTNKDIISKEGVMLHVGLSLAWLLGICLLWQSQATFATTSKGNCLLASHGLLL